MATALREGIRTGRVGVGLILLAAVLFLQVLGLYAFFGPTLLSRAFVFGGLVALVLGILALRGASADEVRQRTETGGWLEPVGRALAHLARRDER
jgi:hypothetical protein